MDLGVGSQEPICIAKASFEDDPRDLQFLSMHCSADVPFAPGQVTGVCDCLPGAVLGVDREMEGCCGEKTRLYKRYTWGGGQCMWSIQ